jgi:hypothetical protein
MEGSAASRLWWLRAVSAISFFQRMSGKYLDHLQGGVYHTFASFLGRRGIRPHFSDQDVGLVLVASIEHPRLLRGAAKSDG